MWLINKKNNSILFMKIKLDRGCIMKNRNNGFTLVELLAVIVILAIDRQQIERTIKNVFMTSATQTEVVDKYLKYVKSIKLD